MADSPTKPVQWLKHKYACHKPVKNQASRGGGSSSVRAGRRKLNATQKALLPKQPNMVRHVGPTGKARMVKAG